MARLCVFPIGEAVLGLFKLNLAIASYIVVINSAVAMSEQDLSGADITWNLILF